MTSNMKDASKIGSITLSYSVRRGDTLGSILPRQIRKCEITDFMKKACYGTKRCPHYMLLEIQLVLIYVSWLRYPVHPAVQYT